MCRPAGRFVVWSSGLLGGRVIERLSGWFSESLVDGVLGLPGARRIGQPVSWVFDGPGVGGLRVSVLWWAGGSGDQKIGQPDHPPLRSDA